ncbi:MAG: translation initiation factor IF-6 [Candidatus Bathyarchaeota archaeon]|uniref:translation initiation factor IF-6 n=1 Tax=Candidatus Bathycorpusculum sp. TaxID=2994959 RepID=UPI002824AC2F|nr:translation initiation factor IF-6 [Candidatus Termiticorpusculum sp.]MCL2257352.1 translation initiation factor IF-6 [Candidatus Termiticorpusculum sp.]MCL2292262.1 translation initiation factor IF-6 [Candidatus Termiticorpusculum sp.]
MTVYLSSIVGSASIGVYTLATENVVIVPCVVPQIKAQEYANWLKVKLIYTAISGSTLVGALASANSNGMILPNSVREEELTEIRRVFDGTITIMETKKTAYGNLILANDKGAVADPRIKEEDIKKIAETLGVEVLQTEIAGLPYIGSLATVTNKGVIAHPLLKEEERKILEQAFKVPVDVGTVNCGIPYVGTGLIANSYHAVAGSMTTGPEMFIIGNAMDVVQEVE